MHFISERMQETKLPGPLPSPRSLPVFSLWSTAEKALTLPQAEQRTARAHVAHGCALRQSSGLCVCSAHGQPDSRRVQSHPSPGGLTEPSAHLLSSLTSAWVQELRFLSKWDLSASALEDTHPEAQKGTLKGRGALAHRTHSVSSPACPLPGPWASVSPGNEAPVCGGPRRDFTAKLSSHSPFAPFGSRVFLFV